MAVDRIIGRGPLSGGTVVGDLTMAAGTQIFLDDGTESNPSLTFTSDPDTGLLWGGAVNRMRLVTGGNTRAVISGTGVSVTNSGLLGFDTAEGIGDLFLGIDAANIAAWRNGTNAQTWRLYETFTDASNNQGLAIDAGVTAADTITITPFENGTGADSQNLVLLGLGAAGEVHLTSSDSMRFQHTSGGALQLSIGANNGAAVLSSWTNEGSDTAGTQHAWQLNTTFSPASGTPKDIAFGINPVINWGGTPGAGNYEVLSINSTETAIPTGTNYLARWQVDTFDIFRATTRGAVSWGNFDEGGTAAWIVRSSHDSVTLTGATTDTTTISVPSGARLLAVLLNVDTAVVNDGDDTWKADFVTGSTTAVAALGTAAAQNTKITLMLPDEITTGIAQIRFTPQGANFTAGVIECVVYYEELTAMANA